MEKEQQIEEIATAISNYADKYDWELFKFECENLAIVLHNLGYSKLPEDSVVLSREEYEKLKSLYDTKKGAFMSSKIGDLPLTIAGLRKAVDEITRLNNVEAELQELNIKYYNEAKDLRRQLANIEAENKKRLKASEDFATKHCRMKCEIAKIRVKEFAEKLKKQIANTMYCRDGYVDYDDTMDVIDELLKEYEQ